MKKKTLIVQNENIDETVIEMSYFSYTLVGEKKGNRTTKLTFTRDVEVGDEIKALEERYFACQIPSFKPLIVMTIVTFILLTTLLICFVSLRGTPYDDILFYTFGALSLVSLIILSVIFYIRMFRINRNVRESREIKDELNRAYEEKIKEKEKDNVN